MLQADTRQLARLPAATAANKQQQDCKICLEAHPAELMHVVGSCLHSFCIKCLAVYLKGKLDEGTYPMSCPEPLCNTDISVPECRLILKEPASIEKLSEVRNNTTAHHVSQHLQHSVCHDAADLHTNIIFLCPAHQPAVSTHDAVLCSWRQ